ncbi:MAG: hypothetical protein AAB212_02195, partial [Bacteroidota bacterium]
MKQTKTSFLSLLLLPIAIICFVCQLQAQNTAITGKVIDATTSYPIEGATVSVKNVKQKTST